MDIRTHQGISSELCGSPVSLEPGKCVVAMTPVSVMTADDSGLVHGGFVFGMADYAAMLAVNDPNVVLGSCEMRFLKPVRAGEKILATAEVKEEKGKKRIVDISVTRAGEEVAAGSCTCFVLDKHVLAE
ncbi:PaaI family thioesterase [Desulfovibrio sp. OttesenSCG-928-O18]|nr:PaaI family thioesterase [Desulfovibrio sp. OttesenSCG-928-O18]